MDITDIWAKLTEEEKNALSIHQQKETERAIAKAKKENTRRNLDKQDREKVLAMLADAECTAMPLMAVRTIALRWLLSDAESCKKFVGYIKSLQDGKQVRKAIKD